jgi:signal transduction histidine kinase
VIWDDEALKFFQSMGSEKIVLDVVISHGNYSQTGYGFEDLVNSINDDDLKNKIEKVRILDTAYLYRHCRSNAAGLSTVWLLSNKDFIAASAVEMTVSSWPEEMDDSFQHWHKQIMADFEGNEDQNPIQEFRELVIANASVASHKGNGTVEQCTNFILEECAYIGAHLRDTIIAYPMQFYSSVDSVIERYKLNIVHLCYKPSSYSRKRSNSYKNLKTQDVILFLTGALNANFFVIDRQGNYVYKNNSLSKIVGEAPAGIVAPNAWEASLDVMKTKEQMVIEEKYDGKYYLSVKAPLIVDDEVEGIMGVSIDITDRKRTEELEYQSNLQKMELQEQSKLMDFTSRVAHDLGSPLTSLECFLKYCDGLSKEDHSMLKSIVSSIRSIADGLLVRYKQDFRKECLTQEQYVCVYLSLRDVANHKKFQFRESKIAILCSIDPSSRFAFVKGDYSSFSRMISNLLNNSLEAVNEESGVIELSLNVEGQFVSIRVKDNGKGMPAERVERILKKMPVGTTKASGFGLGLGQVSNTLEIYNGQMAIKSQEGVGTEITLKFPLSKSQTWIVDRLVLKKGSTVVIVDDDESVHHLWKQILKKYSDDLELVFFANGKKALSFINSFSKKEKLFLLVDYDLRSDFTGLQVILESGMKEQSIIVTSIHYDKTIQQLVKSSGVKILPKQFLDDVSIDVE